MSQPMSDPLFLLATAYRIVYGVATSYLVARLAPDRPMSHALAFGVVAMALPCAWAGGALRGRQLRAQVAVY